MASGGGTAVSGAVEQVFTKVTAAQQRTVAVDDVVPLLPGDARGLSGFYLVIGWVVGGYLFASMLGIAKGSRPATFPRALWRLGATVPYALLSGFGGAVVAEPVLHAMNGHFWSIAGIGTLVTLSAATVTIALQTLFGVIGIGLTVVLFVTSATRPPVAPTSRRFCRRSGGPSVATCPTARAPTPSAASCTSTAMASRIRSSCWSAGSPADLLLTLLGAAVLHRGSRQSTAGPSSVIGKVGGCDHPHVPAVLRTLRDDPADAEVPSHKLLIRAGYVRPIAPGLYTWLPLGLRVLRKIEKIVREEMVAIGGQEILFPALLPRAPYEATNRWTEYGDGVFRLKDRRGNDYLLGPTHEEFFTLTVKGEYSLLQGLSAAAVPNPDQVPRRGPAAGGHPARARVRHEGLLLLRHRRRRAQERLPRAPRGLSADLRPAGDPLRDRLGGVRRDGRQRVRGVPGRKRGRRGHLRALPAVRLRRQRRGGDHGGARRAARRVDGLPEADVHDTGDTPTIATLVEWANAAGLGREVTAADTLKNVLLKVRQPGGDWELLAIGVPGDREVDDKRLGAALEPAEYAMLDDADFARYPFLVKGYIGPKGLLANGVRYLVDPRVAGRHVVDHRCRRNRQARGRPGRRPRLRRRRHHRGRRGARRRPVARTVRARWCRRRGIEIGHIFQLGRKYTDAFSADVLGEDGKPVRLTMGSYGVGVSRLVAVIAEQHHDELGLRWPTSVSPFDVHVVIANKDAAGPHRRRGAGRPTWTGWASRCCSTTAPRRPG